MVYVYTNFTPRPEVRTRDIDVLVSEVGPRDGLQSVRSVLPLALKTAWVSAEASAGVREIEVGSFVPAHVLPQLADTAEVVRHAKNLRGLTVAVLVSNLKGAEAAIEAGADKITLPVSASETHSLRNVRRTHAQMLQAARAIAELIRQQPAERRPSFEGGLSTAFGCTLEGAIPDSTLTRLAESLMEAGCDEVGLSDTSGYADPSSVKRLVRLVRGVVGKEALTGLHLHNTRGLGLANALAGLDEGITTLDASLGGLGGCPFAPGASGNIVTEDLVFILEDGAQDRDKPGAADRGAPQANRLAAAGGSLRLHLPGRAAPGVRAGRCLSFGHRRRRSPRPVRVAYPGQDKGPLPACDKGRAAMIRLYTSATPNGYRASIMLEECGLPYEVREVDMKAGEHKSPQFLAVNATGRLPAIVDDETDDGVELALAETLAIALYLAEKSDRLSPERASERALAYQWAATVISGFGAATPGIFFARQLDEAAHAKIIAKFFADIQVYLAAMDAHLAKHTYLAGSTFSFADVLAIPTIKVSLKTFAVDLSPFPAVLRWRDQVLERPAVQRGFSVPR